MAKAASPVRLQAELMQQATRTGKRHHRSAAEQVEYWAEIGRRVSRVIDPDALLSISAGLARVKVEPLYGEPVDPEDVFQALETQRDSGSLAQSVTGNAVKYQASVTHPGLLERIDAHGDVTLGQFMDGEFRALTKTST